MKFLRRLYFRLFPHYRVIRWRMCDISEANRLLNLSMDMPEAERWMIYEELQDKNTRLYWVFLCQRERSTE